MLKAFVFRGMLSVSAVMLCAGLASGQEFPNKPIRIVTGAAGGGSDSTARQIGQGISGALGQQVIVDNQPGLKQMETAGKAAPDGYTMLLSGASLWILPLLQKVPYDPVRDFSPVSLLLRDVNIVVVHPSVPAKSIAELIALAKAKPGQLNYASTAIGGPPHLGVELLKSMGGFEAVNIPYKGPAPAITALLSGEVQLLISDVGLLLPYVKSGKLRALAVTSAGPSTLAPGVPTVAASGVPGYESIGMTVMVVPTKTPAPIIARLNQEIVRFLNVPDVKERFLKAGSEVVASSPEQFAATMKSDSAKWSKVIKDAGIKAE